MIQHAMAIVKTFRRFYTVCYTGIMMSDQYWNSKYKFYGNSPWQDDPSIFAVEAIHYFPGTGRLLDLGAGQGHDSHFFAQKGYDVTSTDFNDLALDISKKKSAELGLVIKYRNIDLALATLPFGKNTYDVVFSHLSLHYFDDAVTTKLFEEIHRVLKPNGILAFFSNSILDNEINDFEKISPNLYRDPGGLQKRYMSTEYVKKELDSLFDILQLDLKGQMLDPSRPKTFLRFIGKKK